jgi:hypothetical protein
MVPFSTSQPWCIDTRVSVASMAMWTRTKSSKTCSLFNIIQHHSTVCNIALNPPILFRSCPHCGHETPFSDRKGASKIGDSVLGSATRSHFRRIGIFRPYLEPQFVVKTFEVFSEMSEWIGQRYEDILKQSPCSYCCYCSENSTIASPGSWIQEPGSRNPESLVKRWRVFDNAREIASKCHHNVAKARGRFVQN